MINDNGKELVESELQDYGMKTAPLLEELKDKLPNFLSAMLCTVEGFNICSLGFGNDDIAKMAAVSSSLYAMAKSVIVAFSGEKGSDINIITINGEDMDILGKKIILDNGKLVFLILASKKTKAGMQLYLADSVASKIKDVL